MEKFEFLEKYEELETLPKSIQDLERMKKILYAKKFCDYLLSHHIIYDWCIKHPEVLGCDMSKQYYQRYQEYIGEEYSICKNLLVQERKGEKRIFLIIVDESKSVDLKEIKEKFELKKLEFVKEEVMKETLHTFPGNVSVFHMVYDLEQNIHLYLDKELFDKKLLAFHPLYNGMSLFLKPEEILSFLTLIHHSFKIEDIPAKKEYVLKKEAS